LVLTCPFALLEGGRFVAMLATKELGTLQNLE
jgi:hypothetical protein